MKESLERAALRSSSNSSPGYHVGVTSAVATAACALAIGALSNTVVKMALAVTVGRGRFRRAAGTGLVLLALVGAAAIWFLYR